ncbi:MAG: alpha/beta hydrolase [Actinobacteria bacterium]|nr:alpha/beta hydrolase [Actinomycetota bacterium]
MGRVLVLHGPDAAVDRHGPLAAPRDLRELDALCDIWGAEVGVRVDIDQPRSDEALLERLRDAAADYDGVVLHPGPLAFESQALAAALLEVSIPVVEVQLRDRSLPGAPASLLSPACVWTIHGRGADGFRWALHHLVHRKVWPVQTFSYGDHPDLVADVRLPVGDGRHPVVVLLHGGFWLQPWERDLMEGVAVDLTSAGAVTVNLEYRRVGGHGGWPTTAHDVAAGIGHLEELAQRLPLDTSRLTLAGHSAGAQLAVWYAASAAHDPGRPRPVHVVTLGGVLDLPTAHRDGLGGGAVSRFIGDRSSRLAEASPLELVPIGVPQTVVHGADDRLVPASQGATYAVAARASGDAVDHVVIDGAGHFDVIDPRHPAWATIGGAITRGA